MWYTFIIDYYAGLCLFGHCEPFILFIEIVGKATSSLGTVWFFNPF